MVKPLCLLYLTSVNLSMHIINFGKVLRIAQFMGVVFGMFYDSYIIWCEKKGVSPTKAALDVGLSCSAPTKWKKTGATPSGDTMNRLASYFGITVDELLGKEKQPTESELSDEEKVMLDLFRQAGDDARRLALLALEHGEQK